MARRSKSKAASRVELPEEVAQLIELKRLQHKERVEGLAAIVSSRIKEAVSARKASGIERIWLEDEEFYLGIDDASRANHAFTKGLNASSGLSSNTHNDNEGRCTAFFNITRQFVDSAAARMGDILLPAGDWNFSVKPTPIPDLEAINGSAQPVVDPASNQAMVNPDGTPYTLGQFADEERKEAEEKVSKAEEQIKDWLVECHYHSEVRKVIEDAAKIGTGILRGPFPAMQMDRAVIDGALVIEEKVAPTSKRIDPNNFFPDPACGDDIQSGSYVIERDLISPRRLRKLKDMPGYLSENIDKVLDEGPGKCNELQRNGGGGQVKEDDRYEIWYYFGTVNINDLDALGAKFVDGEQAKDEVPAVVVMVNDTVIKGFINPLDNGEFPYDLMPWQRVNDSPWGVGIARQGRVAQEKYNSAGRALMNNMGLSSASQIVLRQSAIRPADGEWIVTPGKLWLATEEADTRSVGDAFMSITIPSMQNELTAIQQQAKQEMEDATGVSFLLQGQQGSAPDTVGGMQLLHTNSSALLRRIARVFDECVTEPHIRRYYDWLLVHGEDDCKGDMRIEAIGSTALVEREIQAQQAQQLLQMALNPAFEMSPKKAKDELLRAWRFDPSKFDMDEKEKQAAQQQQPAPQVQAAQIRAQVDMQTAQMRAQIEQQRIQSDTDRDTIYVQSQQQRDTNDAHLQMQELQLRRELALLEYANQNKITLDTIRAQLAEKAMALRVQKELAAEANSIELMTKHRGHEPAVISPPVQIPGRAHNGEAFEQ